MRRFAAVFALLLLVVTSAWAHPPAAGDTSGVSIIPRSSCLVEVLTSEELPGAPIFRTLVRARLRITPRGQPPFERTVERFISWQEPPPRRGQRLTVSCDPTSIDALVPY